jgi:hypothetical protein
MPLGDVQDVPVIGGGPLDGTTLDVPLFDADQDVFWVFAPQVDPATGKLYYVSYEFEPVGETMQFRAETAAPALLQPDLGLVYQLETTNPCITAGFTASATLPATSAGLITFSIVNATASQVVVHWIATARSTSTGCIFVSGSIKPSYPTADGSGNASRTHPYVRPAIVFSQWMDPNVSQKFSNLVYVQTW